MAAGIHLHKRAKTTRRTFSFQIVYYLYLMQTSRGFVICISPVEKGGNSY